MENPKKSFCHKRTIILIGVLMLINQVLFIIPGLPVNIQTILKDALGYRIPDMTLIYPPDHLSEFLKNIGAEGRQAFQKMHITIDFTFPLLYGLFFYAVISFLTINMDSQIKFLPLLSFFASGFDMVENFTLVFITDRFPMDLPNSARLAQISTLLKFLFILLNLILIIYLGFRFLIRNNQKNADVK